MIGHLGFQLSEITNNCLEYPVTKSLYTFLIPTGEVAGHAYLNDFWKVVVVIYIPTKSLYSNWELRCIQVKKKSL